MYRYEHTSADCSSSSSSMQYDTSTIVPGRRYRRAYYAPLGRMRRDIKTASQYERCDNVARQAAISTLDTRAPADGASRLACACL